MRPFSYAGALSILICRVAVPVTVFLLSSGAMAQEPGTEPAAAKPRTEIVWEWGAYYTSVGPHVPLSAEPVLDGGMMTERQVYARLLANSLRPSVLLIEASVYPMPVLYAVTIRGSTTMPGWAAIVST